MHAACAQSDIAVLTLSWINEQLRQEVARRTCEADAAGDTLVAVAQFCRPLMTALASGLCGLGLLLARWHA